MYYSLYGSKYLRVLYLSHRALYLIKPFLKSIIHGREINRRRATIFAVLAHRFPSPSSGLQFTGLRYREIAGPEPLNY